MTLVVVHIVTFNSERAIARCIQSVIDQRGFELSKNLRILVTDNASSDDTITELRGFTNRIQLRRNAENTGFTGAHNQGAVEARKMGADFLFILNPDVRLEPDALGRLVEALANDPRAGMACPKLLRADAELNAVLPLRFDSTGIYMTPELRHFDRGSNQLESGQYDRPQYVFGATGAAMLLGRRCIEDVSFPSDTDGEAQLFDPSFFAYREDAELSWRLQALGWKCRYEPTAVGYHERQVLPENRAELKPELNAYSVRNRFLMQSNHLPYGLPVSTLMRGFFRNMLVIAGTMFREKSSAPALRSARALAASADRKRKWIRRKTRVRPNEIGKWFRRTPAAEPALAFRPASVPIESITAIVVNYNSGERLRRCVETIVRDAPARLRVCVVDNGSTDGSLIPVREIPGITILEQGRNSGFAAALNRGAAEMPADAFLVLNPDISINSSEVTPLCDALDNYADLGAVSPVLRGPDGRLQWGYLLRELPTLASTAAELMYLHRLCPRNRFTTAYLPISDRFKRRLLLRQNNCRTRPFENPSRPLLVGQPAAACLLVRAAAWKAVRGFDESFFPAWFEDVDFSKRLAETGYLSAVEPGASAFHEGGYSTASLGRDGFYSIWYPNLLRYWRKHAPGARFEALRLTVCCALLCRAAASYLQSFRSLNGETDRNLARTLALLAFTAGRSKVD